MNYSLIVICTATINNKNKQGPKFGSVLVPAENRIATEIPVSVPARFEIPVPAEISVQI